MRRGVDGAIVKKLLLPLLALLTLGAGPAWAQSPEIQGRLINGTHKTEGKAETVTLLEISQGMDELATLKEVQGSFTFPLDEKNAGPFLIRATYQGVNYFKSVGPFQAKQKDVHEITVYDPVADLDKAEISLPHLFIKRDQDKLMFIWNFEVKNPTSNTMHKPGGLFRVFIPDNAEEVNVSASSGTMPLRADFTKDAQKNFFIVDYAIKPGKTTFQISYAVDYAQNAYTLEQKAVYPLAKVLTLVYPEDMQVESDGLKEIQVDANEHVKVMGWESVPAGSAWKIKVSGGSKIAAPAMAAAEHSHASHGTGDHQVVEKPPAIAGARWLIWGLMAAGLGINVLLFLLQKSSAPAARFEFSRLQEFREKLAKGAPRQETVKQAWNAYLEETGGR